MKYLIKFNYKYGMKSNQLLKILIICVANEFNKIYVSIDIIVDTEYKGEYVKKCVFDFKILLSKDGEEEFLTLSKKCIIKCELCKYKFKDAVLEKQKNDIKFIFEFLENVE